MGTHLTERVVKAAEIGSRKYVLFDEDCPGFGLCVFESGRKGFVLIYRAAVRGCWSVHSSTKCGGADDNRLPAGQYPDSVPPGARSGRAQSIQNSRFDVIKASQSARNPTPVNATAHPAHWAGVIRSLRNIQASTTVSIPNRDEETEAYLAFSSAPADKTLINAMPSAMPMATSQGSALRPAQKGCLNTISNTTTSNRAVTRVTSVLGISWLMAAAGCPKANVPANPAAAISENNTVGPMAGVS